MVVILPGTADGTSNDPLIAATAGDLVLYFVREYSQVLGFWFDMAKETSPQHWRSRSSRCLGAGDACRTGRTILPPFGSDNLSLLEDAPAVPRQPDAREPASVHPWQARLCQINN
ncbi:hypothetical protein [Burkholderia cenocepacia]|uniref:hypothetical protein n=1 Tax=Burkholderia cenocepacia TaxID=95486 RepID=UPI002854CEAD|nr:hypothetical protein [Burkholderia cenocepacia]MDR8067698.1 hypothetical protein [Burkholderia cenocepacia]